jgi:carbamoyltransferase
MSEQTQHFITLIKEKLVTIFDDGSIYINQAYFEYAVGERMTNNAKWAQLFGLKD